MLSEDLGKCDQWIGEHVDFEEYGFEDTDEQGSHIEYIFLRSGKRVVFRLTVAQGAVKEIRHE